MSTSTLTISKFTQISEADAQRLLTEKLPDFRCLACDSPSLELLGNPSEDRETREVLYPHRQISALGFAPTLIFSCKHCGYMHNFDFEKLASQTAFDGMLYE